MSMREDAIAAQKLQYNSGKPCRKGHHSDRYTSNGMCMECIRLNNEAMRGLAKTARIKRNTALFAHLRERIYMVRDCDAELMGKFAEVLQYSNPGVIAQCKQFIEALYAHTPIPRALTRDDLLSFMNYRNGQVLNLNDIELSHPDESNPTLCIIRNGLFYSAEECMQVLRNQKLNVLPK